MFITKVPFYNHSYVHNYVLNIHLCVLLYTAYTIMVVSTKSCLINILIKKPEEKKQNTLRNILKNFLFFEIFN